MSHHAFLDLEADPALFSVELPLTGMVASFHENERPLQGLAGLLDWRLDGEISRFLRAGVLSGRAGECAYLPVSHAGRTLHIVLVGAGRSHLPGERGPLPEAAIEALRKNIGSLKLGGKIGISRSDLGDPAEKFFASRLGEIPLSIVL